MELFVFDLDFTIWDAGGTWCDCTTPPYRRVNGYVEDGFGREIRLYEDVPEILRILKENNIPVAVASRTHAPGVANELLELFKIDRFFDWFEIYPGSKLGHFSKIQRNSGISYNNMVFFDDEMRNIREISGLGVTCEYVSEGVNLNLVTNYL